MQVGAGRNVLDRLASWASNGVNPAAVLDAMVDRNGAHYLRDIGNMMAFLRGNSELARNSEVRELLRSKYGLKYFYPDEIYERLGEYPEHRVVHVVDPDNPRRLYPLE